MICQLFVSKCPDVNLSDGLVSTRQPEEINPALQTYFWAVKLKLHLKRAEKQQARSQKQQRANKQEIMSVEGLVQNTPMNDTNIQNALCLRGIYGIHVRAYTCMQQLL